MCLISVRIFEYAKTKMKLLNQVFTCFSLLDDVTMTSLYPFRGIMHPLVCSCTVPVLQVSDDAIGRVGGKRESSIIKNCVCGVTVGE